MRGENKASQSGPKAERSKKKNSADACVCYEWSTAQSQPEKKRRVKIFFYQCYCVCEMCVREREGGTVVWCSECLSFVCVCVCVSNPSSLISLSLPQSAVCVWTGLLTHFLPLLFFFCWLSPPHPIPHIYKAAWSVCPALFPLLSLFPTANFPLSSLTLSHTTKVSFSYTHSICVPMNELHPASKRPSLWPKNLLCIDHHMVCPFTGLPACLLAKLL